MMPPPQPSTSFRRVALLNSGAEVFYLCYGTVTLPDGQPARAIGVKLFDQDLRKREALDRRRPTLSENTRISYDGKQFQQAESGEP